MPASEQRNRLALSGNIFTLEGSEFAAKKQVVNVVSRGGKSCPIFKIRRRCLTFKILTSKLARNLRQSLLCRSIQQFSGATQQHTRPTVRYLAQKIDRSRLK